MPLRDVLRIGDEPPHVAQLVENITQIMETAQPDTDVRYSIDEVLTAMVYALSHVEQEVVELREFVRLMQQ